MTLPAEASETIGLFGGSFDPPHVSHVLCAAYVLAADAIDELLVVPSFAHALDKKASVSFEHRFQMTALAMQDLRRVRMSRIEEERGGVSKTLDTLEALAVAHPLASFRLVIGADILDETRRWYRWDRVVEIAPPIVVGRGGYASPREDALTLPVVSSIDVRARLREGRSVVGLVPRAVEAYIREHSLYAAAS